MINQQLSWKAYSNADVLITKIWEDSSNLSISVVRIILK